MLQRLKCEGRRRIFAAQILDPLTLIRTDRKITTLLKSLLKVFFVLHFFRGKYQNYGGKKSPGHEMKEFLENSFFEKK